jgi:Tfp pilus assembly protein PilW
MNRRAVRLERQTGWGLAEMMVGVMISMIAVLVIFESFSAFEAQKRTTTSAIAAQEAGLLALSAIERDARVAGYGLVVNNALACTTINIYQAGALAAIPAMPIAIADGGATASDSITFMSMRRLRRQSSWSATRPITRRSPRAISSCSRSPLWANRVRGCA